MEFKEESLSHLYVVDDIQRGMGLETNVLILDMLSLKIIHDKVFG